MVRTLAVEWAERNIRVNAFHPGYLEHAMSRSEDYDSDPEVEAAVLRMTPMRRRGRVDEVVGVTIFLASDASSFMTRSEERSEGKDGVSPCRSRWSTYH